MRFRVLVEFLLVAVFVSGCVTAPPRKAGIGPALSFSDLPGWRLDHHAEAWPSLLASCATMPARDARWRPICGEARRLGAPDDDGARRFFEQHFTPHRVVSDADAASPDGGLITGYYEPVIAARHTPDERYRHPLLGVPDDLLTIDLGALYPDLKGRTLRGRLEGRRVVPYATRGEMVRAGNGAAPTLAWLDDPVEIFFLQIQGSGRLVFEDGTEMRAAYADQNGHPYTAIGRVLKERGAIPAAEITADRIRAWLREHPGEAEAVLDANRSYVFFRLEDAGAAGPKGALGVPLHAGRSCAVDPAFLALGLPLWMDTTAPDDDGASREFRRLLFAQDTGGAIKGAVRADVFFGTGEAAGRRAGLMKQSGRLFALLPR